jgi:hypothetical protein
VYVPVLLPPNQWSQFSSDEVNHKLESALPPGREVLVQIERVEGGQAQIGVRASLASMQERAILEAALLQALGRTGMEQGKAQDGDHQT